MQNAVFVKLRELLNKCLPEWSSSRAARLLKVNPRTVQRWLKSSHQEDAGEERLEPSSDLVDVLEQELAKLERSGFPTKLAEAIADAREAGVHDEIVGAWLAFQYRKTLGIEIE